MVIPDKINPPEGGFLVSIFKLHHYQSLGFLPIASSAVYPVI